MAALACSFITFVSSPRNSWGATISIPPSPLFLQLVEHVAVNRKVEGSKPSWTDFFGPLRSPQTSPLEDPLVTLLEEIKGKEEGETRGVVAWFE